MFNEKDIERLWFFYKTEDGPKGVSINSFPLTTTLCAVFYNGFKKIQKKIVPVKEKGSIMETIK